jgi:hypothetical protein
MALISRIFLHSRNQQQDETNQSNMGIWKPPVYTSKKKIPTPRKVQSKIIKTPNHLKIQQNTNTLSLKLCMPHQALLT